MVKKSMEDYMNELQDKISTLVRERNNLILEMDKKTKELEKLVEQQFVLDENKIKIKCLGCKGLGYVPTEDGKKQFCPMCGGPDKPYLWADKYTE